MSIIALFELNLVSKNFKESFQFKIYLNNSCELLLSFILYSFSFVFIVFLQLISLKNLVLFTNIANLKYFKFCKFYSKTKLVFVLNENGKIISQKKIAKQVAGADLA
jgi:hypothetical protein